MSNLGYIIVTSLLVTAPAWIFACEEPPVLSCPNTDQVFISENGTHIVASNSSEKCRYAILKEPGICQVRLDFILFELGDADPFGDCTNDNNLLIEGSRTINRLGVCGNLTGQHMYLDFGDSERIDLTIRGKSQSVAYDITSTQIKCNSPSRAPPHCLQYFRAGSGTVKSFNYPRQQLNNQKYTVCIEESSGSDSIVWRPCAVAFSEAFFVSGNSGKMKTLGPLSNSQCHSDYVQVFGENRRCGNSFPAVTSAAKPYMLHVAFDSSELPLLPPTPIVSLPVAAGTGSIYQSGNPCPDMSAVGLVCTPPPVPCDATDLGGRRAREATICTCTSPAMNADAMNIGFCLDFSQN